VPPDSPLGDDAVEQIRRALRDLTFGSITITVHDGAIVQIDRTEKLRVDRAPRRRAG
jgi:hypothetical protein